jgi:hypothetical protein
MVEMMHACEMMFTHIEGDIRWADRCEDVAFNSYPAALTADMKAHRYLTAPNMPVSDRLNKSPDINNGGAMFIMNPHAHRCCQHNLAHGWPYYAEHLWLATPDDGLCAMLYSDSTVSARVAGGQAVSIRESTHYPFSDTIKFEISTQAKTAFPLYLRVPGWCETPRLALNGQRLEVSAKPGKYIRFEREWHNGDLVELTLPMQVSLRTWTTNQNCVSVDRGPLTYSLQIEERYVPCDGRTTIRQSKFETAKANFKDWPAFEIFPSSPWNYGLVVEEGFQYSERPWPGNDMPWTHAGAPVILTASAKLIPGWKLQENNLIGKVPPSPVKSDKPLTKVKLLPMGACRLRLSAFPAIGSGADARPFRDDRPNPALSYKTDDGKLIVVSAKGPKDVIAALVDGVIPTASNDRSISRMTFWPHLGSTETITIELGKERVVSGVEVYWFDDTGKGGCRVPAAAHLSYFTDDEWMPAKLSAAVPVAKDKMNRLEIIPTSTTAIQLKIELQKGFSGGLLELKVF